MKSSDVMIGDWVINDQEPTKVNYLTKDNIGVENAYFVEFSDVEPIPLTEEILYINGFELRTNSYRPSVYMWYHGSDISISTSVKDHKTMFVMDTCATIKDILFVHELQHYLRFFGLHELADNFKIE